MSRYGEFSQLRDRLADLAHRFDRRTEAARRTGPAGPLTLESVLADLRDLFTRGVTQEGLQDLVRRDPRAVYRFYTAEIDFDGLAPLPWYRRWPAVAWRIFVATAHRLAPARRIAFAAAILAFLIGSIEIGVSGAGARGGPGWWLLAIVLLALLLLMELRDKLDLKHDLEIAREIQVGLIPSAPFARDGTSVHGIMRPANTVGGDYYDVIELDAHRVAVIVGDVAGKGMPAALLLALLQGSLRTLIAAGLRGPELIAQLNRYLHATMPSNRMATLFYGEIDTDTGLLRYVNAGHNPPFLLRGAAVSRLSATSLILGAIADARFEADDTRLMPGDRLVLFTDGISEAFDAAEQEYGEARLAEFVCRNAALPPDRLGAGLVEDVQRFCGAARPTDDMTVVVVDRPRER